MASLQALAIRNLTTFLAGILMVSPVAGLRPVRALRFDENQLADPRQGETDLGFLVRGLCQVVQQRADSGLGQIVFLSQVRNELCFGHWFFRWH